MPRRISRDEVVRSIRAHRLQWQAGTIELLGEGDYCTAYLVDGQWVGRFARHHEAAASIEREACLLPRIADRFDLQVPDLTYTDGDPPFTTHPLLPSTALTRDRYDALPGPARDRCATQLATFVQQLHQTPLDIPQSCGIPSIHYAEVFGTLIPRATEHLYPDIEAGSRAFIETAVNTFVDGERSQQFTPVLRHGDLSPDHVLFDPDTNSLTGVIDFGDASVGDPAWDLVFIYEDYGLDFLGRFVRRSRPRARAPLLERMFRLWVLAAIEWAVLCAERNSKDLPEAIEQLRDLQQNERRRLDDVLRISDS